MSSAILEMVSLFSRMLLLSSPISYAISSFCLCRKCNLVDTVLKVLGSSSRMFSCILVIIGLKKNHPSNSTVRLFYSVTEEGLN